MGLLKFTLKAIDNVAWPAIALGYPLPAIALGYPLFASIRAVGTDSKYHMRKLVMYWIVFSLLSLFEFAFAKIIDWIPYWSSVRFAVICWLVIPEFEGSCLVTPALLLKLQQVFGLYRKVKEERLSKTETISDVVEKYAKENGSEALEKPIASKKQHESQDCIDHQRGTKAIEAEGENTAAISKEVRHEQSISSSRALNGTCSIANAKEIARPEVSTDNRRPQIPPLEKIQQEWTCDLCNFTTTNVSMLDAHLRLSNHKSKLESLKATLLDDRDSGPSPSQQHVQNVQPFSATSKFNHGNVEEKLIKESGFDLEKFIESMVCNEQSISLPCAKEMSPIPEASTENRCPQREWRCELCKVNARSEKLLIDHLLGRKHNSKFDQSLKVNEIKIGDGEQWCIVCDVKLLSAVDAASSHFKGKLTLVKY